MPAKKKPVIEEPVIGNFVEQYIPRLINTKLSEDAPSAWFVVDGEGKVKTHFGEICHSQMCHAIKDKWDELYTAVPKHNEMEIAYIRMLIHGPFKAYSDLISLEKHGKGYVLHVTDLDKIPANILYNFVVASRVPMEHAQLIEPWYKGVELGFDPVLSFLLSYSTNGKPFAGKRTFDGDANQTNHFWFYKTGEWKRIICGDFVADKVSEYSYKANPAACRPTNQIWGSSNAYVAFTTLEAVAIAEKLKLPIEPPAADPPKLAAIPKKAAKPLHFQFGANPFPQIDFNNIILGDPIPAAGALNPAQMPEGAPQPIIEEIDEPFDWDEDEPDFD